MSSCDNSNIRKNYIVTGTEQDILSACTAIYTNSIENCSGNTLDINSSILSTNDINATNITLSGVLSACTGIYTSNIYGCSPITIQDELILSAVNNNNTLEEILVIDGSGLVQYRDLSTLITGSTTFVTGTTFNSNQAILTRNDGFDVLKLSGGSNVTLSNPSTNQINIDVSIPPDTNTFVTGFTYDNTNNLNIIRNDGVSFDVNITEFSGITVNGVLSACTGIYTSNIYGCSPITINDIVSFQQGIDVITGNTILKQTSATTITLTSIPNLNNTATQILTRNVTTGLVEYRDVNTITPDANTFVTGFTYDNVNTFTISRNDNVDLTSTISILSGITYYGDGSNLSGVTSDNFYVTGGTYNPNTDTITFTNNTGGTFTVTGITDTFTTGGTYDNGTKLVTYTKNDNTTYTLDLSTIDTNDTFVTGGTYNSNTDTITLTRNDDVDVNITGITDTFTTGSTYDNGTALATFTRNDGNTYTLDLSTIDVNNTFSTGGTITQNSSNDDNNQTIQIVGNDGFTPYNITGITDTFTTGGTYNNGTALITFDKNDGTTFDVDLSTLDLNDTFVTGFTYDDNNTLTITRNDGVELNTTINNVSGLTVNGTLSALTIDGGTILSGGTNLSSVIESLDTYVTGGTVSISGTDNSNNGTIGLFYKNSDGTPRTLPFEDTFTTGGTYNNGTALITFDKNDGTTYDVDLSTLDLNDTFVTGFTYDGINTFTITRNDDVSINSTINILSGITYYGSGIGLTNIPISGVTNLQTELDSKFDKSGGTVNGNVLVTGDVTILGTATTINTETLRVKDHLITLNSNATGNTAPFPLDSGLEILRNSATTAVLLWEESNQYWTAGVSGDTSRIVLEVNDGYVTGNTYTSSTDNNNQTTYNLLYHGITLGGPHTLNGEDTYVTGGTYDNGTALITFDKNNNTSFDVDLSTLDLNDTFSTGGTITQNSSNNQPNQTIQVVGNEGFSSYNITGITDTFTTGGTYDNGTALITFDKNDGTTYDVDLSSLDLNDTYVTGGTLTQPTDNTNSGLINLLYSQDVSPSTYSIPYTDTFITGFTYDDNNTFTIVENNGDSHNVTFNEVSGLTVNGDLSVTGNTYLVDISGTSLFTDYIDFNNALAPLPSDLEGRIYWDEDNGTLSLGMHGGQVVQQIGLEHYYYVKNQSGATISNGRVVRAAGTLGSSGRILGEYMIADGTIPAKFTLGIATEDIVNGDDGYVTEFGLVRGIDATGSLYGESWSGGTILYVSPTIPGGLTSVEPTAPDLKIEMAIVIDAAANGSIFVRPSRYPHIYDLQEVNYSAGTENNLDILQWNESNLTWDKTNTPSFSGLTVFNNINHFGNYILDGDISQTGNYNVTGNTTQIGNINLTGDLGIIGNTNQTGNLNLTGNTTQIGDVDLTGNVLQNGDYDLIGNLDITGNTTQSGNTTTNGTVDIIGSGTGCTLSVTGKTCLDGDLEVTGDVFVVGNLDYDGNLIVTGSTLISSGLTVFSGVSADFINITTTPNENNDLIQILGRNSSSGLVEYRDVKTIGNNITVVTGSTYSATTTDDVIGIDSSTNTVTLYLPDSVSSGRLRYDIKDIGVNSFVNPITVQAAGSDTIITTSVVSSFELSADGGAVILVNTGTGQWWQM